MTIKELKAKIADLPDNMDVMVEQTNEEFRYSLVETAEPRKVRFGADGIPKKDEAIDTCFIITDL